MHTVSCGTSLDSKQGMDESCSAMQLWLCYVYHCACLVCVVVCFRGPVLLVGENGTRTSDLGAMIHYTAYDTDSTPLVG